MEIHGWQEAATMVLSKAFPSGDYKNWGTCETLSPHAREVLRYKPVSDEHLLARGSLHIVSVNKHKVSIAVAPLRAAIIKGVSPS
jgi:hypothetical protein